MAPLLTYLNLDISPNDHNVLNTLITQGIKSDNTLILDPNRVVAKSGGKVSNIDRLLGGKGWLIGEVNEVCGSSGSGKTRMCLKASVQQLLENETNRVYWIETADRLFSAESAYNTALDLFNKMPASREMSDTDTETLVSGVLDRITISTCPDVNNLLHTVQLLHQELVGCAPTLVVVDSLSTILIDLLWAADGAGPATVMHISRQLRSLAQERNVAVLVSYHHNNGSAAEWPRRPKPFIVAVKYSQAWLGTKLEICDGYPAVSFSPGDTS
ncbi:hypothetical protein BGZ94_006500 [Podila epigama]|nr:hypothetical protein BGZ94_006500 [Podila epigama]